MNKCKAKLYSKLKNMPEVEKSKLVLKCWKNKDRFVHFAEEDIDYLRISINEMWEKRMIHGVLLLKQ